MRREASREIVFPYIPADGSVIQLMALSSS
jgi:hypothetical protein